MTRHEGDSPAGLPVALAAVSVDGRCRERNPPDVAIFGAGRDRLVPRFSDPGHGQALLARCIEAGTAETVAQLATEAGPRLFRISLWRQRGGERIRILAAFAAIEAGPPPRAPGPAEDPDPEPAERRLVEAGLAGPVETIIALADRLRGGIDLAEEGRRRAEAETLLAAAWRLSRICDDLEALGHGGARRPGATRGGEIEVRRLLERLRAAIEPSAEVAGATLRCAWHATGDSGATALCGAALVADEGRLWTLLEMLVRSRLDIARSGETLTLGARVMDPADGLSLEVVHAPREGGPAGRQRARRPDLDGDLVEALAESCGAVLEMGRADDGGWRAELRFPPRRCMGIHAGEG